MTSKALTLKGMTDGSGCTARTVRYYEREGLLKATRTTGGHRLFAPVELERLRFIIQLREAGWALEEVTEFLSVRQGPSSEVASWANFDRLLAAHIGRLERKIEVLGQLRADLGNTAALLPVCRECVQLLEPSRRPACGACERMPPIDALPVSFRLSWRAPELAQAGFDEAGADEVGADEVGADEVGADEVGADEAGGDEVGDEAAQ